MVHNLIQWNFGTIVVIISLLIFMFTNVSFEKNLTRRFMVACVLNVILVLVEAVEYAMKLLPYPTTTRVLMSAIGYSIRPIILLLVISVTLRNRKLSNIFFLPALVNIIIAFSALFSKIAYSYSPDNQYVRGPLGYAAHIVSGLYVAALLWHSVRLFRENNPLEGMIVFFVILTIVLALLMEMTGGYKALLNTGIAISVTFYYMYLNLQYFKRDQLTMTLNRRCYQLDVERNFERLTAILLIDLNDLKRLNDTIGHAEGDKAIQTMVSVVRRYLPYKCHLYRIGGDEFMVLCFGQDRKKIKRIIPNVKRDMGLTKYSCAMGLVFKKEGQDIEQLTALVDDAMYRDKEKMKKKLK